MMFCIGAVVRSGNRAQKAALLNVLRRHISASEHAGWFRSHVEDVAERESDPPPHQDQQCDDAETLPSVDMGRYASALKEHGDQVGFTPIYKVTKMSKGSPSFRASVLVDGSSCEGVARTKKQARHEAAKKACLRMDIEA